MPQTVLPGPADTIASPDQIAQPVPVLDDTETAATEPAVTVPPRLTQAEADALAAAGIASGGNIGQQIGTTAGLAGLTYGDPRNLTEQQRAAIKYTGSVPAQSSILGTTGNAADLELVQKLRKEFEGLPEFQAWSIVNTGYQNMLSAMDTIASLSDETDPKRGPADMRLLYNYLRLLDPRTGIKEGEYATAEQAGGKVAPLLNLWNSIVSGDKLDAPTREAFMREAKGMYDVASQTLTPHIEKLTKEAEIGKIDPGRVVTKPAPSRTFGDTVFDDADIAATMKANPTMTRQQVIDALVAKGMTYGGT
jgi:hypothetical protein